MVHWKLVTKRILRRLRFAFRWKELLNWEYESCERCGHCFKICWSARDQKWVEVYGSDDGCLCIDCFVELAEERGISVEPEDIERMGLFVYVPEK